MQWNITILTAVQTLQKLQPADDQCEGHPLSWTAFWEGSFSMLHSSDHTEEASKSVTPASTSLNTGLSFSANCCLDNLIALAKQVKAVQFHRLRIALGAQPVLLPGFWCARSLSEFFKDLFECLIKRRCQWCAMQWAAACQRLSFWNLQTSSHVYICLHPLLLVTDTLQTIVNWANVTASFAIMCLAAALFQSFFCLSWVTMTVKLD